MRNSERTRLKTEDELGIYYYQKKFVKIALRKSYFISRKIYQSKTTFKAFAIVNSSLMLIAAHT